MKIPTVIASFCWSLPICKRSDLLFWITLNTSDHFHLKWLKVLLLLLPYHMQKTNFITQLILAIKLTICCHFGHLQACLSTPTWNSQLILSAFLDLKSYPKIQLQESFILRFLNQIFANMFWQKVSKSIRFLPKP